MTNVTYGFVFYVKSENFFRKKFLKNRRKLICFFSFYSCHNSPGQTPISNMSASVVSTSPAPKARAPRVKKVKVDTTVDVIPPAEVAVDAKPTEPKPKKPTLPAKFAKFMQFGFFFVSAMKDASVLDDSVSATLLERLCVFASVDEQKDFYQAWLNSAKESNKTLRKSQTAARKAALPPKTRQPRAKKDPSDTKPKKPRAKKADKTNDLVNQLSELANENANEVATELPSKKPRKPRAKKNSNEINDGNLV